MVFFKSGGLLELYSVLPQLFIYFSYIFYLLKSDLRSETRRPIDTKSGMMHGDLNLL